MWEGGKKELERMERGKRAKRVNGETRKRGEGGGAGWRRGRT